MSILDMPQATGKHLDRIGEMYGVKRWRWWVFAWPLDRAYRQRITAIIMRRPK